MNPDNIKMLASIAGIIIGFFGVVTVPITLSIKSLRNEIKADMKTLRVEIKADMQAMESRLNERINTHLVHR